MISNKQTPLTGDALRVAALARLQGDLLTAAEEVLAEMSQTRPELGFVKRAIAIIRTWLRANMPGFADMKVTDAEIIQQFILPARRFVERGASAAKSEGVLAFSRDKNSLADALEPATVKQVGDKWAAVRYEGTGREQHFSYHATEQQATNAAAASDAKLRLEANTRAGKFAYWWVLESDPESFRSTSIGRINAVDTGRAIRQTLDARVRAVKSVFVGRNLKQIPSREGFCFKCASDAYVVGPKSKRGLDLVAYIKRFDDGSTLYIEEVRTGKNRMAMLSMRKYPGTKDFNSIAQTLLSNAQSDAREVRIVLPSTVSGQVDTPAFKKWFGDSKVMDAAGKPLVVYHETMANDGMPANGIEKFKTPTWFAASPETYFSSFKVNPTGMHKYPVYLSLQNPKITTYCNLASEGVYDESPELKGHDGVILVDENGAVIHAVAFIPNQIKSAIGNNGDFDANNPDIRFSRGSIPTARSAVQTKSRHARHDRAGGELLHGPWASSLCASHTYARLARVKTQPYPLGF